MLTLFCTCVLYIVNYPTHFFNCGQIYHYIYLENCFKVNVLIYKVLY